MSKSIVPRPRGGNGGGKGSVAGLNGNPIGNVAHEPTRQLRRKVETLIALGLSQEAVGFACDLSVETLKKYYNDELQKGLTNANARVGAAILQTAVGERDACDECDGTGGTDDVACGKCKGTGEARSWQREPNTTAQIWWSKNRMGWTDRERIEHVGDGGGPVVHEQRNAGDMIRERLFAIKQRRLTSSKSTSDSDSD